MSMYSKFTDYLSALASERYPQFLLRNLHRRPDFLVRLAGIVASTVSRNLYWLERRLSRNPEGLGWYRFGGRAEIARQARSDCSVSISPQVFAALPGPAGGDAVAADPVGEAPRIGLATGRVPFSKDLFHRSFEDDEDRMAVHRFGWLLDLYYRHPSRECAVFGLRQIRRWCEEILHSGHERMFDAYSTSERLVSWLRFLMLAKQFLQPDEESCRLLAPAFGQQLSWLMRNLEYHGHHTNNHVLNNARALYACGVLLKVPEAASLGRAILIAETDRFIVNGVLQEGSSHYQMLLTRSYLEVSDIAESANDLELFGWLEPRLKQMLAACDLLHSAFPEGPYPLFGDISPDMEPNWLQGYPFTASRSRREAPWFHLLGSESVSRLLPPDWEKRATGQAPPWHYLRSADVEAWICLKEATGCHGHNDNGNVVIYMGGLPCIIDPGRQTYRRADAAALRQASIESHNTPSIDDQAPDLDCSALFRSDSAHSRIKFRRWEGNSLVFGLEYLNPDFTLTRRVTAAGTTVTIVDSIASREYPVRYRASWLCANRLSEIRSEEGRVTAEIMRRSEAISVTGNRSLSCEVKDFFASDRYGVSERREALVVSMQCVGGDAVTFEYARR